ncbi:MAG TPA: lipoprotein [Gammaproteobacteria bacterium]|nr:lipoprotein [Gammaproteobacteria bacterium]
MTRAARRVVGFGAALAAFVVLSACGQRGPLTLPASARPIERLDPSKAPPAAEAPPPAEAPPAVAPKTAPADGAPSPEDDERRKRE